MAREVINVGAAPNDGTGDPIRTAYIKCNNNFGELYSRAQENPPNTLIGTVGDSAGMYAYDSTYFYYCFQDYDGSSIIWAQLEQAGNVTGTQIVNGTSSVAIIGSGANVRISVAGTSNVGVWSSSGLAMGGNILPSANATYDLGSAGAQWRSLYVSNSTIYLANVALNMSGNTLQVAGANVVTTAANGDITTANVSATGNITGSNINTAGIVTATGNVTGGNVRTVGLITATGNVISGNVLTAGVASAGGNVTGANIFTAGVVSATGNVSGNFFVGNGSLLTGITVSSGTSIVNGTSNVAVAINGNTTVGVAGTTVATFASSGILAAGVVSATGNVTGNYILGNGSQLTGIVTSAANINNGTSIMEVVSSGGNIRANVGGTANVQVIASTGVFVTGVASASGNITGGNIVTAGLVTAGGNVLGGNLNTGGLITASGNITGGNILASGSGQISTNGNVTGGIIRTATVITNIGNGGDAILNGGGNGVGNIGNSSAYFNTVFATATTALYADLAELYLADADYQSGTVVKFGGSQEITQCDLDHDAAVAGVISDRPAYQMNSGLSGDHVKPLALAGRVRCQVVGPVLKGQMLVSAGGGRARAEPNPRMGAVIGKALQDFDGSTGTIEIVVGRL